MTLTEIGDDLWRAQDPSAARLRPKNRRWLWCAVLGALLVAIAPPLLDRAGAFRPRIHAVDYGWQGEFVDPDGRTDFAMTGNRPSAYVSGTVAIANDGWSTVRILDVSVAGKGFRFDHATARAIQQGTAPIWPAGSRPLAVLEPGGLVEITLYFHITDCHAVAAEPRGITARVDSWRGVQEVTVPLPTVRHQRGGWTVTGPADPQGISPIRYLADASCQVDMGG